MYEITGKYAKASVMCEYTTDDSDAQIRNLLNSELVQGSSIAFMPDHHPGSGCIVGTTMTLTDKISPYWLGSDLGCGVMMSRIDVRKPDLKGFDKHVKSTVQTPKSLNTDMFDELAKRVNSKPEQQYATLGGGNHFIEIDKGENGYYLVVHTGSRGFGAKVAEYWQTRATGHYTEKGKQVVGKGYLDGEMMAQYLADVEIAQRFARMNREAIMRSLLTYFRCKPWDLIDTPHNFQKDGILRKGAISGDTDELAVIPMNMAAGCILVKGKGNAAWNKSLPHGAGRVMSRADCKANLSMEAYKQDMNGIVTSSMSISTIDESPRAYKDPQFIMDAIEPNALIVDKWGSVYNYKNSEK